MKKTFRYIILYYLFFAVTCLSCDKLLEKPIGNDITEETIFSNDQNALTYLAETYRQIIPFGFPYFGSNATYRMDRSILAATCDEANFVIGWSPSTEQNTAGFVANDGRLTIDAYRQNYVGIRYAWKFIENVDNVPEFSETEKAQMKAECLALIALRYSHMLKNYGGVSLVKKSLSVEDEIQIARSSVEETVNYILALCDEALVALPNGHESQWKGRVTAGVALAVKAETLLFAASPLLNSADTPLPFSDPQLIAYGNYDVNRWKQAADAAKAVIDWAGSNGYHIINTGNPFQDFGTATSVMDNPEVLFAYKGTNTGQNGFTRYYLPTLNAFNEGNNLTYNFLHFFRKADGSEQSWPEIGETERDFEDYETRMEQMEPRFKSSFWKYGAYAWNNPTNNRFMWNFDANILDLNYSGVAKLAKFTYDYQGGTDDNFNPDWNVFRLAEFYLNLAEALNEYQANSPAAYEALNIIRQRAGLPAITPENPLFNTQESFRALIRRERAVELYAEEHRPYDVRRWKIAHEDGVYGGPFYTFQYTKNAANNAYLTYRVQRFEDRYWNDKMYFCPFPEAEVNKGYLLQNPGY